MYEYIQEGEMIEHIIKHDLLEIYFQPIVSIRNKKICAYEALTRCTYHGINIPPEKIFEAAKQKNLLFEIDVLTRKKAIDKFHSYYLKDKELILFLNFESTYIDTFTVNHNEYGFSDKIKELNIPTQNFMLEVKEDEIKNSQGLIDFCSFYKDMGFLIALDDFGTGNSNFNRINIIKPALIKIDKSLFVDIKNNQINKEIVGSISNMCKNIGIQVLAEGVEDKNSINVGMKKGIDLFQGYYFSRAVNFLDELDADKILSKILFMGDYFRTNILMGVKRKRKAIEDYSLLAENIINKINSINELNNLLEEEYINHENIEAFYLIDAKSSKQINNTVINIKKNTRFKPNSHGDEHYFKEYYYLTLEARKCIFLSQKYISLASGNICKTFAKKFTKDEQSYILCLDIVV